MMTRALSESQEPGVGRVLETSADTRAGAGEGPLGTEVCRRPAAPQPPEGQTPRRRRRARAEQARPHPRPRGCSCGGTPARRRSRRGGAERSVTAGRGGVPGGSPAPPRHGEGRAASPGASRPLLVAGQPRPPPAAGRAGTAFVARRAGGRSRLCRSCLRPP